MIMNRRNMENIGPPLWDGSRDAVVSAYSFAPQYLQ